MNEWLERKKLRRDIGSYGWALLIYYFVMNVCVIAAVMIQSVIQMVMSGSMAMDEAALMGNGWGYLVASALAVLLIRLWKGREFFHNLWKTEKQMTNGAFWKLLCVCISAQLVFQIMGTITELILNLFGLSVLEAMEMATGGADTFSMYLYLSLGAPIVEELIFRGLVLRGLEKYGRRFAIWTSAFLFGIFHGNLIQSPYAFLVGLVLGYVAAEYNILWAMVLHMVNNLVLGDMLPRVTAWMGEMASGMVQWGVIFLCSVLALVILIRNRHKIREYRRADLPDLAYVGAFAIAPGVILLTLLMMINAVSMLLI